MKDLPIDRIRTWTLRLPVAEPFRLGRIEVSEREYVVLRADTDEGRSCGIAWSLTRGLPIGTSLDAQVAPHALGASANDTARTWHAIRDALGPSGQSGTAMRALSLLDIALWDLKAQQAGLPLHRLLGGLRDQISVAAVSGYPVPGLRAEQAGERLRELHGAGHRLVKLARWPDPADTASVIAAADAPPGTLVVDAAWAWEDAASALAELRRWGEVELAWLEDPIPATKVDAYRRLRERCPQPLGVGDEVSDLDLLDRFARGGLADLLRVDATVAGGITGAQRLLDSCWLAGVPVSLHVGLPIHLHLAAAHPACTCVEAFVGDVIALDPFERLLRTRPEIEHGSVRPPDSAGLGIELDWEQITTTAHSQTESKRHTQEPR